MKIPSSRDSRIIVKTKLSSEIVNNSNVLQNDDDLFWSTVSEGAYSFFLYLWVTSPAAADIKFKINEANSYGEYTTRDASGTTIAAVNDTTNHATDGSGQIIIFQGLLIQAIAAGTVNLQWAQLAPTVGDTIVGAGSMLIVIKQ